VTDLPDETVVIFRGETSFAYEEWTGPLFAVSGTNVKVAGENAATSILNGNGADYWDGGGGSSGKTKPKFFQAHDLTDSLIETLTILNPPVQVFSINGASNLELAYITIDGSAGDSEGKNTDGFDIGDSDTVTIGKQHHSFTEVTANKNSLQNMLLSTTKMTVLPSILEPTSSSRMAIALVVTASVLAPSVAAQTTPLMVCNSLHQQSQNPSTVSFNLSLSPISSTHL
jgi:hypothetical protein